ncbi:hypothetical protein FOMPIDRAFT_1056485 [Fomitopsis schrenkii]|nr:hypothetical protein FOMPIDRAFT_1056485 [Fomitopsis schrenkii]
MLDNIPSGDEYASAEDDLASDNESTWNTCEVSGGIDGFAMQEDGVSSFGNHNNNGHTALWREVDTNDSLPPVSPILESFPDPLHNVPELQAILSRIYQSLEATQSQVSQLQDEVISLRGDMREVLRHLRDMAHQ